MEQIFRIFFILYDRETDIWEHDRREGVTQSRDFIFRKKEIMCIVATEEYKYKYISIHIGNIQQFCSAKYRWQYTIAI